jgi:CubicO group peptidase (beta-lactamase class C family)
MSAAIRDSVFPGAQLAIARDGILVCNKSFGTFTYQAGSPPVTNSTLFDLASLTKVIATTSDVMKLHDEGMLDLADRVSKFIPEFAAGEKADITIRQLLTHTSGLPAHREFYKICKSADAALDSVFATRLVDQPGDTTIYSDLGMITLGKVVEHVTGSSLDEYSEREFFDPLQMGNTMFNPPASLRGRAAPTEVDTAWRKKMIQGTVHDENAWFLGGVSGHAGLFSTASDLAVFMQMIMNGGVYGGHRYLQDSTVKEFVGGQGEIGGRALGWDTKSIKGSSAGDLFSSKSFGHTGFTGTSIWADPVRNLFVVLLTNRVYPTRNNNKIHSFRPKLHDAVLRALMDDPSNTTPRTER